MASWSKETLSQFIEIYRSKECLWRIKSKDYCNKLLREKAYETLVKYCKKIDPKANRDTVSKKINSLKSSFRKELKKHEQSKLSGAGLEEIYEPKLWYFQDLQFLRDQEIPRGTRSNIETLQHERQSDLPELAVPVSPQAESEASISLVGSEDQPEELESQSLNLIESTATRPQKGKKNRKRKSDDDDLLKVARARLLNPEPTAAEDQFDVFGKSVAHRLRKITREQRIHAQKFISDILYEAELGQLSGVRATGDSYVSMPRSVSERPPGPTK